MNIEFEEFSTEEEMLEFVKSVIPEDYDEVYTARHHHIDNELFAFRDDYDLEEFMKDYVTQNAGDPEQELTRWDFAMCEIEQGKLIKRKVFIYAEYSLELRSTSEWDWEEAE